MPVSPSEITELIAGSHLLLAHRVIGPFLEAYSVVADRLVTREPAAPLDGDELTGLELRFVVLDVLQQLGYHDESLRFIDWIERVAGDYEAAYFRPLFSDTDPSSTTDFWMSSGTFHLWNFSQRTPATEWERQQEYIEKTQDFIRRNIAGQKTKQAKSRRKMLERMEGHYIRGYGDNTQGRYAELVGGRIIVRSDPGIGSDFTLFVDGSDVGLSNLAISAFDVISDTEILISFTTPRGPWRPEGPGGD